MSDLVRGRYPVTSPFATLFGLANNNAAQSNIPIRSNAAWMGVQGLTDGALAASGVCCAVPVPVEPGDTFAKVSILVGATAASTPTHSFAALYSGIAVPALIGQSTDGTTAAIAASARFDFTLTAAQTITQAQCPNGFIYAVVSVTGTAVPTAAAWSTPTATGYQWFTAGCPLFLSATHGSAVLGTAPATIASPAAKAVAPLVLLS